MSNLQYKHTYRRHLPHIQPPGATLFVTFRLEGSLPRHVQEMLHDELEKRLAAQRHVVQDPTLWQQLEYQEQNRLFGQMNRYLDSTPDGPHWLKQPAVAQAVAGSLHHRREQVYDLDTFCIMSNHVHLVFTPLPKEDNSYHSLSSIMHSLKLYTARCANTILQRSGGFWQKESYDHVVRDEAELGRIRSYVLANPVRAGLVSAWNEWEWSFSRYLQDE